MVRRDHVAVALATFVVTRSVDMVLFATTPDPCKCDCGAFMLGPTMGSTAGVWAVRVQPATSTSPGPSTSRNHEPPPSPAPSPPADPQPKIGAVWGLRKQRANGTSATTLPRVAVEPWVTPTQLSSYLRPFSGWQPQPPPNRHGPTPTEPPTHHGATTRRQCYRMPSWGDVCLYHNACFAGTHWYFFDQDAPSAPRGRLIWSGAWVGWVGEHSPCKCC